MTKLECPASHALAFLLFMFRVCRAVLSVHSSLVVTCCEMALLYVVFSCVFITYPCGILGQVWCLIVSIRDLCLLPYFVMKKIRLPTDEFP